LKQLKLAQTGSLRQAVEKRATADGWNPTSYIYVLAEQKQQQRDKAQLQGLLHEGHLPGPKPSPTWMGSHT